MEQRDGHASAAASFELLFLCAWLVPLRTCRLDAPSLLSYGVSRSIHPSCLIMLNWRSPMAFVGSSRRQRPRQRLSRRTGRISRRIFLDPRLEAIWLRHGGCRFGPAAECRYLMSSSSSARTPFHCRWLSSSCGKIPRTRSSQLLPPTRRLRARPFGVQVTTEVQCSAPLTHMLHVEPCFQPSIHWSH